MIGASATPGPHCVYTYTWNVPVQTLDRSALSVLSALVLCRSHVSSISTHKCLNLMVINFHRSGFSSDWLHTAQMFLQMAVCFFRHLSSLSNERCFLLICLVFLVPLLLMTSSVSCYPSPWVCVCVCVCAYMFVCVCGCVWLFGCVGVALDTILFNYHFHMLKCSCWFFFCFHRWHG